MLLNKKDATAIYFAPAVAPFSASYLGVAFMRLSGFPFKLVSNFDQGEIEEAAVYT